ncbi:hypothetical protein [Zobellia sp. 1_MG-2023]|uniref:hypothetical protein n=1 Tax=Zobellia sp. 1_MG-2023 TaxID=3062626 RepID=UPI0026E3ED6B|nr:hypothetical protein [Zobellia sp. 1_MG-2023]MDO6819026.1 hypothetical protein [Zobellia sp. 1_MG-2023]
MIELNDTEGEESITITDKNSNKIFLNTKDSSISITAPGNLSLNADTIDIKAKKGIDDEVRRIYYCHWRQRCNWYAQYGSYGSN